MYWAFVTIFSGSKEVGTLETKEDESPERKMEGCFHEEARANQG